MVTPVFQKNHLDPLTSDSNSQSGYGPAELGTLILDFSDDFPACYTETDHQES